MRSLFSGLLMAALVFSFSCPSVFAKELFLLRNARLDEPVGLVQVNALKKKTDSSFRPGDRVTAVYLFNPAGTEETVEFRWLQQVGRTWVKKESYTHRLERQNPGGVYVAYSWVVFDSTFFDRFLGSGFPATGWWRSMSITGKRRRSPSSWRLIDPGVAMFLPEKRRHGILLENIFTAPCFTADGG